MDNETHPQIVKRLKRAEGHLRSVIAIEAEEPYIDVAQQLHAVERALGEENAIQDHRNHCPEGIVGPPPHEQRRSIESSS